MEEEQRINMFNLRSIDQVRSQTPCYPPVIYIQDDMAIHNFDSAMANVSIGLAQYLMVYRIIGKIRVYTTKRDMQQLKMKYTTW